MIFYEIAFDKQPKLLFACSIRPDITDHSRNVIDHRTDILEITRAEDTDMILECDYGNMQETVMVQKRQTFLLMPDCRYIVRPAETSHPVQLTSVAVKSEGMNFTRHVFEETSPEELSEILQNNTILLPQIYLCEPEEEALLLTVMKSLIARFPSINGGGVAICLSKWYELCAILDMGFRAYLRESLSLPTRAYDKGGAFYYATKIKKYIHAHLREKIRVKDIAELLHLSDEYVGKVFRRETGYSINDYIARQRVQKLCEAIRHSPYNSFSSLTKECGIRDFRYAQRIFRKYTGVSMSEYRALGDGVTLYHENPWSEDALERDIFTGTWEERREE